jgi:hypothetical protein
LFAIGHFDHGLDALVVESADGRHAKVQGNRL